jgi:hypothetical protein
LPAKTICTVAEEPLVELRLLVGQVLADAVADDTRLFFSSSTPNGDAVDVEHKVRPPLATAIVTVPLRVTSSAMANVVLLRRVPVDEMHGLRDLARLVFTGTP